MLKKCEKELERLEQKNKGQLQTLDDLQKDLNFMLQKIKQVSKQEPQKFNYFRLLKRQELVWILEYFSLKDQCKMRLVNRLLNEQIKNYHVDYCYSQQTVKLSRIYMRLQLIEDLQKEQMTYAQDQNQYEQLKQRLGQVVNQLNDLYIYIDSYNESSKYSLAILKLFLQIMDEDNLLQNANYVQLLKEKTYFKNIQAFKQQLMSVKKLDPKKLSTIERDLNIINNTYDTALFNLFINVLRQVMEIWILINKIATSDLIIKKQESLLEQDKVIKQYETFKKIYNID